MGYTEERDALGRTPQALLVLAVPICQNWYAKTYEQGIKWTDKLSDSDWVKTNATITSDTTEAPDGSVTADTIDYTAATGSVEQLPTFSITAAIGDTYTGSVWLRTLAGSGTITLRMYKSGGGEVSDSVVTVTTTWTRFDWVHVAPGTGVRRYGIRREAGDLAQVVVWRANMTKIPALDSPPATGHLFPTRLREGEITQTLSVNASRCQAADAGNGSRCSYSAPTCQDPANFNAGNDYEATVALKGLREYKFCLKQAPLPIKGAIMRPMLASFDEAPQEIDGIRGAKSENEHGGFVTRNESVTYRLEDDADPGNFDLEKASEGALTNTARGSGTFWRRWLAIHRNFDNPRGYAKLYTGYVFSGVVEADFRLRLSGPIVEVKVSGGGIASIESRDGLHVTKRKIPSKISQDNLLVGAIDASVTSINVDDPTEISDPAPNANVAETFDSGGARTGGPDWVVVLQLGTEKMTLLAKTAGGNPLTVTRGRWGTTAIAHADNEVFSEVREYGTEQLSASAPVLGANPLDIKLALYREAGIPWAQINSAFILDQRATWVYSSVDRTLGLQSGILFRRTLTEQTDIDTLLQEIDRDLVSFQYVDEDRLVTTRIFAAPAPTETLVELTDATHFLEDSIEVEQDNEARLSRVALGWDLIPGERGDVLGDYAQIALALDPTTEGPGFHGSVRDKIILSQWIRATDIAQAKATSDGILARFIDGARIVTGALEARDDDSVKLGVFVYVTTDQIQKPDGSTDTRRIMQVIRKERDPGGGRMKVRLLDTGILHRPIFFAENTIAADYDSASEQERRYWFIGNAANRVGAANDDGYYITR
jgi:hypothetical protein